MKEVIVIGATGLIGNQIVNLLPGSKGYSSIHIVSRTKPVDLPQKVLHIPFDNGNYVIPNSIEMAFCCLGTTMKKAGSKEAFQNVDLNMVIDFARKAKEVGVKRFAVVSSIGANPKSGNFYLRTKGKAEEELKKIGFDRLVIVRPSLLLGKRKEKRIGEDIGKAIYSIFRFLFIGPLRKYRGIEASDVAKAMIALAENGQGTVVVESEAIKTFQG